MRTRGGGVYFLPILWRLFPLPPSATMRTSIPGFQRKCFGWHKIARDWDTTNEYIDIVDPTPLVVDAIPAASFDRGSPNTTSLPVGLLISVLAVLLIVVLGPRNNIHGTHRTTSLNLVSQNLLSYGNLALITTTVLRVSRAILAPIRSALDLVAVYLPKVEGLRCGSSFKMAVRKMAVRALAALAQSEDDDHLTKDLRPTMKEVKDEQVETENPHTTANASLIQQLSQLLSDLAVQRTSIIQLPSEQECDTANSELLQPHHPADVPDPNYLVAQITREYATLVHRFNEERRVKRSAHNFIAALVRERLEDKLNRDILVAQIADMEKKQYFLEAQVAKMRGERNCQDAQIAKMQQKLEELDLSKRSIEQMLFGATRTLMANRRAAERRDVAFRQETESREQQTLDGIFGRAEGFRTARALGRLPRDPSALHARRRRIQ